MKMTTDEISRLFRNMALHIDSEAAYYNDDQFVNEIIQETFCEAAKVYCREDRVADPSWELAVTIYETRVSSFSAGVESRAS